MGFAYARRTGLSLVSLSHHSLPNNSILHSPGGQFRYRIIGPCCRLFDREQLPWPCCRIQWHSKEPSWRRIGNRFVPDMAAKRYPTYSVEVVGYGNASEPTLLTLYTDRLSAQTQDWWYTRPRAASPGAQAVTTISEMPVASTQIVLNLETSLVL